MRVSHMQHLFFFFNDTATTEIYTLSLTTLFRSANAQLAVAVATARRDRPNDASPRTVWTVEPLHGPDRPRTRSEEHTSELQSRSDLVCRLLLEKKTVNTRRALLSPRRRTL